MKRGVGEMAQTDAQREAVARYHAKFDEFKLRVPRGEGDALREHARSQGETVNQFLVRAVKETRERDLAKR